MQRFLLFLAFLAIASADDCPPTHASPNEMSDFVLGLEGVWDGMGSLVFINTTDGTIADSVPVRTTWTIFHNIEQGRIDWVSVRRVSDGIKFQDTYDVFYAQGGGRSCSVQLASTLGLGVDTVGIVDDSRRTITTFDVASRKVTSTCRYHTVSDRPAILQVGCEIYDDQGQGYLPEGTLLTYQARMRQTDSP